MGNTASAHAQAEHRTAGPATTAPSAPCAANRTASIESSGPPSSQGGAGDVGRKGALGDPSPRGEPGQPLPSGPSAFGQRPVAQTAGSSQEPPAQKLEAEKEAAARSPAHVAPEAQAKVQGNDGAQVQDQKSVTPSQLLMQAEWEAAAGFYSPGLSAAAQVMPRYGDERPHLEALVATSR